MPDQPPTSETDGDVDDAAELVAWVRDVLAPSVNRDLNTHGQLVWCSQWWAHPEAVAQLHALAMAYSTLVEDEDASADDASTRWLQHADPTWPSCSTRTPAPSASASAGTVPRLACHARTRPKT